MARKAVSKPWEWSAVPPDDWTVPPDEFVPVALRWNQISTRKRVLDLGCGRGRVSLFLAELGFSVTAADLSADGIGQLESEARRRGLERSIKTLVCDMVDLPFADGSFDFVVGFHSIYHTDLEGLRTVVSRITRMLTPTGVVYLTFNSKSNPSFMRETNERIDSHTIVKTSGLEKGIPHTYLDSAGVRELLAGFQILKMQHIEEFHEERSSFHFFVEAAKRVLADRSAGR